MAIPLAPFYSQADQDIYARGNKFIPQEQYRLGPYTPPAIMGQNTNAGIVNTQAAGSYMGYPSYEAWLLAQGGGGDGGAGNISGTQQRSWSPNQNLGPTNITDYEAEAAEKGSTWAGTLAKLQDDFSNLPLPSNLLRKGIRRWRENREIKKEQERIAEDRTGIGDHDRGTFTGDHPDAPTKTPEQGGWHPGVGRDQPSGDFAGKGSGRTGPPGRNYNMGGRIGYERGRVVNPGGYQGKDSEYDTSWRAFTQNPGPDLTDLDIDDALRLGLSTKQVYYRWMDRRNWRNPNKAQGGRIGYREGDPVIPEDENEDIYELMRDQNIPMSEQVQADPFQMRIEELMGKGLSWEDAYDIAAYEFQDDFAEAPAESFSDQGLASLV